VSRNALLIVGGILGILRGILGAFSGIGSLSTVSMIESIIPGYTPVFVYEFVLSFVVLGAAIFVLVKSNDPGSAGAIRGWGIAIIIAGVIDLVWTLALVGGAPEGIAAGLGSLGALALIGGLFVGGASRLSKASPPHQL